MSALDDLFREASSRDIVDLLHQLGVQTKGRGGKVICLCPLPFHSHHNNTPSFSVYWWNGKQHWRCHGQCSKTGDIIDLAGYLWVPGYRPEGKLRVKAAEVLTGQSLTVKRAVPPPPEPMLPAFAYQWFLPISDNVRAYARSRGIPDELIDRYYLGSATNVKGGEIDRNGEHRLLSIPCFHHDQLVGIKFRVMNGNLRYFSFPGSRKGLFGFDDVYLTDRPVLVVKGEIAAMVCTSFGYLACAPTGGEASMINGSAAIIQEALALAKVIVVGENDANPDTRRKMTAAAELRAASLAGVVRFPAEQYKGVDDFLLADSANAKIMIDSWIAEAL